MSYDQVSVLNGILKGETRISCDGKKYHSFEGIPYAKPPIGQLRFRDPQEPEPWKGVRDATKPGKICPQINPFSQLLEGSEDCLYLNVYTPSLPVNKNEKLPVLFLVHGGSLLYGYGHFYQPDYFIRNKVILVTCNYRMHVLGFLCLHTPEVPGNAGAKDTLMALKWIKNNITYFNGDSNNITVFGESAGAGIATGYLITKMAEGLFDKVIAGSGNCIADVLIDEINPIEKAKNILNALGKDFYDIGGLHDFMVKVPVNNLLRAVQKIQFTNETGNVNPYFSFEIENKYDGVKNFFEEHPRLALRDNRFTKVPILTGMSSHEGAFTMNENKNGKVNFASNFEVFVPKFLRLKHKTPDSLALKKKICEYYFKGQEVNEKILPAYVDLLTDAYIVRDIIKFVELCTKNMEENVYLYRFAYYGTINSSIMKKIGYGATHGDILQYLFYGKLRSQKYTKEDLKIVAFLTEAWCNFARNGKPTCSSVTTEWLPYKPDKKCCLNIAKEITMDTKMTWSNYEFWKSIIQEKEEVADNLEEKLSSLTTESI